MFDHFYTAILAAVIAGTTGNGTNQAPVADAGNDQSVTVNGTLTISGYGSDSDGTVTSYQWKEGSNVLSNSSSFSYSPTTVGSHSLTLTVTDNDGGVDSDVMIVTANAQANQVPSANAGADQSVLLGNSISLTGTGNDPDGTIVGYRWKEGTTTLATTSSFTYTPSTTGSHTLTFVVTDDDNERGRDTMIVTVTAPANQAPTADAGPNRSVMVNNSVTITGSGSDPDGSIISYLWKEGNTVLANSASFSYTPTTTGSHSLSLTVTDDDNATHSDTMTVSVSAPANQAPTANAGADQTVTVNNSLSITGAGHDSDGTVVSYQWKEGNSVLANSASFTYTPTTTGTHSLTLTVTDDDDATGSDTMVVSVTSGTAPTASRIVFKTGQTKSYAPYDDGYYQTGYGHQLSRQNDKDTVTDSTSNLMWQDTPQQAWIEESNGDISPINQVSQSEAVSYCQNATTGGYTNWRMPTIHELRGMKNYGNWGNADYRSMFQHQSGWTYLSASRYTDHRGDDAPPGRDNMYWGIFGCDGRNVTYDVTATDSGAYVRCVRDM